MRKLITTFGIALFTAMATSCGSTKEVEPVTVLTANVWELSAINGTAVDAGAYPNGLPTAEFTKDNKITGKGGCNNYGGSYNLNDEGGMNISQVISTKMFCDGVAEADFFAALEKINMTKIDPDKLTLMTGVDEVLVFVPKK
jgi:heat shock protein HslJ